MSRKTRKLMWSVPLVVALAVMGTLAIFVAQTPGAVLAHDPPGAVSNLKAEADGTKAVDLRWDAPTTGTPTGYRIDASADGQTWMYVMADTGSGATTYRDEMIVSFLGSDRFYRVFALNSSGASSVSRTVGPVSVPDAGAPSNVTGISATAVGRKAIRLTWDEPASSGGSPITRYVIAIGTTEDNVPAVESFPSGDDTIIAIIANAGRIRTPDATRSHTVDGLSPSKALFFRVYAYNGDKVSTGYSETRSATTGSLGKIGPVTGLRAVPDPITPTVELYWYWPADDGGQDITHWLVERKQTARGTAENTDPPNFKDWVADAPRTPVNPDQAFDYQEEDLTPGAKYQYRVTAGIAESDDNTVGGSISSRSGVSNTVTVNAAITPCPPTALGNTPTEADRKTFEDHTARCALNAAEVTDGNVAAERDGKGNVEVTVTRENPRKATSFRIDVSPDGNKWKSVTNYTGNLGSDDEFVLEYLDETTGGDLHYRVFAYVGSSQLLPSNPGPVEAGVKTVSFPGKVESLKATAVSQTQIDVTWSAPLKDGDAVVDMYCVQISDDDGDSLDEPAMDTAHATDISPVDSASSLCAFETLAGPEDTFLLTDQTTYSHKKLKANQTQYYKVYAINNPVFGGDGRSETSDTVSETTAKQDKPVMPTGLVGETAKDSNYGGRVNSGVYLLWNAPPNPTGGSVDSYAVQRKVNGGSWSDLDSDTENNRTIYHDTSEPAAGEQRAYRVAAKNSSGTGPWSYATYYPVVMHTHNASPTAVGMIAAQTVSAGQSVTVDVTANFSDADTGDTLTYTAMSDMMSYATVSVSGSMVTITGVAAGTATITVTATDVDRAMATQAIMVTVEAVDTTPMAPTGVMATVDESDPGSTSVTVTWTDGANVEAHGVVLFANDFTEWDYIGRGTGGSHTFLEVASGSYIAVVVALDAQGGLMPDAQGNYLYAGATVVSVH